jgi:hypothetical protein
MHLYVHVINDAERLTDLEGEDFPDLNAARREADQVARDLMAEELLQGRPLPLGWSVQIADAGGTIRHAVRFKDVADLGLMNGRVVDLPSANDLAFGRTSAMQRITASHIEIHTRLAELWTHLQTLSRLNEAIRIDHSR